MHRPILTNLRSLSRLGFGVAALGVTAAVALPAFAGSASAAQVTSRYIQMSSSASGTLTAGQNVSYEVGFTVPTTGTVQGIVVDFCSNTPIIGDTCTKPTGFTLGATPTVATTGGNNTGLSGTWTAAGANNASGYRTLSLTNGTGGSITAATPVKFTVTVPNNPTHVQNSGTFYARILTFASTANVTTWLGTANGSATANVVDSGGVALSTAEQLGVTAKVQETLTFCMYTLANCAAGGAAVAVGDTNGVLTTAGPFVNKLTKYDIATNAGSGATIRFKAGLPTSGGNTLPSINAGTPRLDRFVQNILGHQTQIELGFGVKTIGGPRHFICSEAIRANHVIGRFFNYNQMMAALIKLVFITFR